MRLFVNRSQRETSRETGCNFALACRVELTDEENNLVNRYWVRRRPFRDGGRWTLADLEQSIEFELQNVDGALAVESSIRADCETLIEYLRAAASYGGSEEVQFELRRG